MSRGARDRFALFLMGWLGRPEGTCGHPRLRRRHAEVPVDTGLRDAWLRCMRIALATGEIDASLRSFLDEELADVAEFLRNTPGWGPASERRGAGDLNGTPLWGCKKRITSACKLRRAPAVPYSRSPTMGAFSPSAWAACTRSWCVRPEWGQLDPRLPRPALQHGPRRERGLAVDGIVELPRPIVEIDAQGKIDRAVVTRHGAFDDRDVALVDLPHRELSLELVVGRQILGDQHHARGVEVEPVNDHGARRIGVARAQAGQHAVAQRAVAARHREQPLGLVDDDEPLVFVQRARLVLRDGRGAGIVNASTSTPSSMCRRTGPHLRRQDG